MNKRALLSVFATLALLAGSAFAAEPPVSLDDLYSVGGDRSVKRKVGEYNIKTEEDFRKKSRAFHEVPFNDTSLEFEIHTPHDWEPAQLAYESRPQISSRLLNLVSRYYGPFISTFRPMVTVQAMKLDHDILAAHWLKNHVMTNGFTQQGDVESISPARANMAWINVSDTQSAYVYGTANISGDTVMLVTFELPLALKDSLGFLQKRIVDSFRTFAVRDSAVETYIVYAMTDSVRFSYPEKWELQKPDFRNLSRLTAMVRNVNEARFTQSLVQVHAIHRKSSAGLKQELETFRTQTVANDLGFNIAEMESGQDIKANSRFLFSRMEVYKGGFKDDPNSRQELRFVVLGDQDWYIFMLMLTPAPEDNFYLWARNTRAFDLMLQSVR